MDDKVHDDEHGNQHHIDHAYGLRHVIVLTRAIERLIANISPSLRILNSQIESSDGRTPKSIDAFTECTSLLKDGRDVDDTDVTLLRDIVKRHCHGRFTSTTISWCTFSKSSYHSIGYEDSPERSVKIAAPAKVIVESSKLLLEKDISARTTAEDAATEAHVGTRHFGPRSRDDHQRVLGHLTARISAVTNVMNDEYEKA